MKNGKIKKIFKIIGDCVFALFMVFIFMFAFSNIKAKKNNGIPNIFGRGYVTVLSNSMEGDKDDNFFVGDLITLKMVNKSESKDFQIGQIITYYDYTENKIITHRITKVSVIDDYVYYLVKGDNTPDVMSAYTQVRNDEVIAIYTGKVKGLGTTISWFQSSLGFFIIVVLPTIIFLVVELVSFIKTYMETKGTGEKKELTEEEKQKERDELKAQLLAELRAEMNKDNQEKPATEEVVENKEVETKEEK